MNSRVDNSRAEEIPRVDNFRDEEFPALTAPELMDPSTDNSRAEEFPVLTIPVLTDPQSCQILSQGYLGRGWSHQHRASGCCVTLPAPPLRSQSSLDPHPSPDPHPSSHVPPGKFWQFNPLRAGMPNPGGCEDGKIQGCKDGKIQSPVGVMYFFSVTSSAGVVAVALHGGDGGRDGYLLSFSIS